MKKVTVISILTLVGYVAVLAIGFLIAFNVVEMIGEVGEGIGAGIASVFLALFAVILGFIYIIGSILPIIFSIISIFVKKKIFPILCLPFDAIFSLISLLFFTSTLSDSRFPPLTIVVATFTLLLSLALLALNIMRIIFIAKENQRMLMEAESNIEVNVEIQPESEGAEEPQMLDIVQVEVENE